MSNDIYKILEGMDNAKSGHKDQVKGTDKPSKGEKKYDGPYTKHPFQGKLVGEVKEDEVAEEFNKFDNSKMMTETQFDEAAGEKDACYHKVKSRYKVWPSAYASGALVQCRKKGAKNWGNSKKKSNENVEMDSKLDVNKLLTSLRNSKTTNSDRLADAIEMRFMHNMTFKEIGEELNVGPSRAAMIVSKALRLLRWHAARNPN